MFFFGILSGAVPLGITTYAPNNIERHHRTLKGLMDPGYKFNSVADTMVQVCKAVSSRFEGGSYDALLSQLGEPWKDLVDKRKCPSTNTVVNLELTLASH